MNFCVKILMFFVSLHSICSVRLDASLEKTTIDNLEKSFIQYEAFSKQLDKITTTFLKELKLVENRIADIDKRIQLNNKISSGLRDLAKSKLENIMSLNRDNKINLTERVKNLADQLSKLGSKFITNLNLTRKFNGYFERTLISDVRIISMISLSPSVIVTCSYEKFMFGIITMDH